MINQTTLYTGSVCNKLVYRIFVERKDGFRVEANSIFSDLKNNLLIDGLTGVRLVFRYDVEGISEDILEKAKRTSIFE